MLTKGRLQLQSIFKVFMIQLLQIHYNLLLFRATRMASECIYSHMSLEYTVLLTLVYSKKTTQRCEAEANPNKFRTVIFTSAKYWPNSFL